MNKYMTENKAYELIMSELGLDKENTYLLSAAWNGEYAELELWTEWLRYDCWVDMTRGELVGVDCEPSDEEELESAIAAAARSEIVAA